MHLLLSKVIYGFLNSGTPVEQLADDNNIQTRDVLDLLESEEAQRIFERLTNVERLRQNVLLARARSRAIANLEELTYPGCKSADPCRRSSEAILKEARSVSASRSGRARPKATPTLEAPAPRSLPAPSILQLPEMRANPSPLFGPLSELLRTRRAELLAADAKLAAERRMNSASPGTCTKGESADDG